MKEINFIDYIACCLMVDINRWQNPVPHARKIISNNYNKYSPLFNDLEPASKDLLLKIGGELATFLYGNDSWSINNDENDLLSLFYKFVSMELLNASRTFPIIPKHIVDSINTVWDSYSDTDKKILENCYISTQALLAKLDLKSG